jgi:hypothetical protein
VINFNNEVLYKAHSISPWLMNLADPKSMALNDRQYAAYVQNLADFDTLAQIPQTISGTKFVYAHLTPVHIPLVFTENGGFLPGAKEIDGPAYVKAIQYTDKRILEIAKSLIQNSSRPPVIVIQADHGYPTTTKRVRILNAFYLPDGGAAKHYNGMTPVNTFRMIFNTYFGQNYPMLPDQSYHTPYQDPPRAYQFDPVLPSCASR